MRVRESLKSKIMNKDDKFKEKYPEITGTNFLVYHGSVQAIQQYQYKLYQEGKKTEMTAERVKLLDQVVCIRDLETN